MDTCINYCSREFAYFSSDERRWTDKILALKEEYPDHVSILKMPEENDGCLYATIPIEWIKIKPKRKVVLTDEEREKLRERMKEMRNSNSKENP